MGCTSSLLTDHRSVELNSDKTVDFSPRKPRFKCRLAISDEPNVARQIWVV
jgi:hypothetical protein